MKADYEQVQAQLDELKAGDRVEVEHTVTVGQKSWTTKTCGTVIRTERRRHGLHFQRNLGRQGLQRHDPAGAARRRADHLDDRRVHDDSPRVGRSEAGPDSDALQDHPRTHAGNRYVYPVISRRAGGLSIGINLSADKLCNFHCIYCQVDRGEPAAERKGQSSRLPLPCSLVPAPVEIAAAGSSSFDAMVHSGRCLGRLFEGGRTTAGKARRSCVAGTTSRTAATGNRPARPVSRRSSSCRACPPPPAS